MISRSRRLTRNIIFILPLFFFAFIIISCSPVSIPRSGRLPRPGRLPRTFRVPRTSRLPRSVRVPRTSRVPRTGRLPRTCRVPRTGRRHFLLQREHLSPSRGRQRPSLRPSPSTVLPPSLNGRHDDQVSENQGRRAHRVRVSCRVSIRRTVLSIPFARNR